jgi:hypothetical protein
LEAAGPRPFSNWGDWLIQRSTGVLGDFRMPVLISIIRSEQWSRDWTKRLTQVEVQRILARYKEHVVYWNVEPNVVDRELRELGDALRWDYQTIVGLYQIVPPKRMQPEYADFQGQSHLG